MSGRRAKALRGQAFAMAYLARAQGETVTPRAIAGLYRQMKREWTRRGSGP